MKNLLIVVFLVAISVSVIACDGDDGETGVSGIMGPSGDPGVAGVDGANPEDCTADPDTGVITCP